MIRCDNQEGLNGSSDSILIKNDSNLDTSTIQPDSRVLETYDLEVQKPAERAKILNDKNFFKKLSYSFYSESTKNSKSYSSLPKHYDTNLSSNNQPPKRMSTNSTKSEPLSKAILNTINAPMQSESKVGGGSTEQQQAIKAFKIKTLQNFYLPAGSPTQKAKPSTPLNKSKQKIEPVKITDLKESPRKGSAKLESPALKQDSKTNSPGITMEKLMRGMETKSPLTATKLSPKRQFIEKLTTAQKISEPSISQAGSSNGFEGSSPNISTRLASPKTTTKLVLLPAGRISEPKKEDRAGSKTLSKIMHGPFGLFSSIGTNINALMAKDTAARLSQLMASRAALKKNIA